MPRPAVEPGAVLVRVRYSLISAGTELASVAPPADPNAPALDKGLAYATLAWSYLGKAVRDPHKAANRLAAIARRQLAELQPTKTASSPASHPTTVSPRWEKVAATEFDQREAGLRFVSDPSPSLYQALSAPLQVPQGYSVSVELQGELDGPMALGILGDGRNSWVGNVVLGNGTIDDRIAFDAGENTEITIVFSNANAGRPVNVNLSGIVVTMTPPAADGLPASEMGDLGWSLGYSVAGEVVAVGEGISDLAPGDLVACAGAGKANHADFVSVRRNLVTRVPVGCSLKAAASSTIGSIALQGVRRAQPLLAETVCVIGLGLIGLITVQLLKANGCIVLGFDPDPARIDRAKSLGADHCASDPDTFARVVRDNTRGRGADRTLLTAATKSDAPINMAMTVTRMKGVVVIVGDIGLNVDRAQFYRKEIDLLMSTSYGPGRYDSSYEDEGRDYPFAYVRWTLNRNMSAYLDLIAAGKVDFDALIDAIVPIDEAPRAYKLLATPGSEKPLGVLIHYPDVAAPAALGFDSERIALRGHAKPRQGRLQYALVGAGGFGTAMLAPQMAKRADRFFLRAVVSRDAVRGGMFARNNRVEVLASSISAVLQDPEIDLLVIATRHNEHADQVIAGLQAGKHVFVEKPLAVNWQQLTQIVETYQALPQPPALGVGFNRRFSPALAALRSELSGRQAPVMISYRLNGGYIPPDHWVQTAAGAGRNIGEACHMYDVFRSLTVAPVRSISAQSIDPGSQPYLRNDNFVATLTYGDGSIGTLVYTAQGPRQGMPKERIEVFCGGEAWIVDDFCKLVRVSDGTVLWEGAVDKGHYEELSRFGDAIAEGGELPISFQEIVETTAVSLHIEDLLQEGGGSVMLDHMVE
jgi:predicted dehydrogenase/threonine dehydrogenase-like Zn-dependent dehydrogenase